MSAAAATAALFADHCAALASIATFVDVPLAVVLAAEPLEEPPDDLRWSLGVQRTQKEHDMLTVLRFRVQSVLHAFACAFVSR